VSKNKTFLVFTEGMKGVTVFLAMSGIRKMMELMVTGVPQVRYGTWYRYLLVSFRTLQFIHIKCWRYGIPVPWFSCLELASIMLPFPDLKNKLYCVTKFFEQKHFLHAKAIPVLNSCWAPVYSDVNILRVRYVVTESGNTFSTTVL
jgi:hypothetical protein